MLTFLLSGLKVDNKETTIDILLMLYMLTYNIFEKLWITALPSVCLLRLNITREPLLIFFPFPANLNPGNNYLFKINNRNTRKRCEKCSELTIKTPELHQWRAPYHVLHSLMYFNKKSVLQYRNRVLMKSSTIPYSVQIHIQPV